MLKNSKRLSKILSNLKQDSDGIYFKEFLNKHQEREIEMRTAVADIDYNNYFYEISRNHSIPVMDREIFLTLKKIPTGSIILDLGGCWGWHWRKIRAKRPDVMIIIVDFVRKNFIHAKKILGDLINDQIMLVHGDATQLPFKDNTFDLVWTVQTFQHIPNFELAIKESYRVLVNKGGIFLNYSLNRAMFVELLFKVFRKEYHIKGEIDSFFLERASKNQLRIIESIFGVKVNSRFTEILFKPEFKFYYPGKDKSFLGIIDSRLSGSFFILKWIARQQSFIAKKVD